MNKKNKFIFQNKQTTEMNEAESVATSSTLLIPEIYLDELDEKIEDYGSLKDYLSYLLRKYELFLNTKIVPESKQLKTEYQANHQNLQRKDFRPDPKDWHLLKLYRVGLNYSISALFVFLLRLDLLGLGRIVKSVLENVGAPYPSPIFQHGGICINTKKSLYSRIFQYY
jgi:hypothetical protein